MCHRKSHCPWASSKFEISWGSPGAIVQPQRLGPHLHSFWFKSSGLGPESLHFWQVLRWGWCCWPMDQTCRITAFEHEIWHTQAWGLLNTEAQDWRRSMRVLPLWTLKHRIFPRGPAVGSLPTDAGNEGSLPGLKGLHMLQGNWGPTPQLLSLHA